MIGTVVGRYRVLEKIGQGGMAEVFKARDLESGYSMALKEVHRRASPAQRQRVMLEARAASSLQHHRIYQVVDVGETREGELYLVMPYYPGQTLQRKILRAALSLSQALEVAIQVADGLGEAHRHGIVHRDIKPSNILLSPNGAVTILDFGLARLPDAPPATRQGFAVGTTAYISPEQLRGEDVDGRADLWSLGVVLYEMCTGSLPFRGAPGPELIEAILKKEPAPLALEEGRFRTALRGVVHRALDKDLEGRYPSAEAFTVDLRRLQQVLKKEPQRIARANGSPRRSRTGFWAG